MSADSPHDTPELNDLLPIYIGRCARGWVEVEYQLSGLLARISNMDHDVASVVVATISSNKVLRDILAEVAKVKRLDNETQRKLAAILRRCAKAAKKRNTLVHAFYLIRSEDQILALRHIAELDFPEKELVIDLKWLNEATSQIHRLANDIYDFTVSLGGTQSMKPP